MSRRFLLLCAAVLCWGSTLAHAALPSNSVYQLDAALTDQRAHAFAFSELRGDVRLVSMFYANCPYVCPLIIDTLRQTEQTLTEAERARLRVVLITLDPERDTTDALALLMDKRKLDSTRWTLARTDVASVRKLAAVLGIQYRQLENREFNHASALILLDKEGRVLARTSVLGKADPTFVEALRHALSKP